MITGNKNTAVANVTALVPAEATSNKIAYDCKVLAVRIIKEGAISFDMEVNGVRIYSMILNEGYRENGEEYAVINFPSRKGSNDKYYSHAWFPISNDLKAELIRQISEKVVL